MDEKKNNKFRIITIVCIIIIILLIIALGGIYYYYNYVANRTSIDNLETTNILKNKEINKIDNNKDLIYGEKTKIRTYNYINGNEEDKEIEIPQINLNYNIIKVLNDKIIKYTKDGAREYFETQYYINDGIISLVLTYYTEGDPYDIFVYNIDTYTGNILTNEELLYRKGITDDIESKIENAVNKVLEENKTDEEFDPEGNWNRMSEVCNDYQRGLQSNIPMFINENGKLSVVVEYCAPAGSGGPWGVITEL